MWIALTAIILLVIFALVMVVAAVRRRDASSAMGQLSRETRSRDAGRATVSEVEVDLPSGKDVERAAVLARRDDGQVVKAETATVAKWTPPDAEAIGVERRKFLNRSIIGFMGLSLGGALGAPVVAFMWPPFVSGFGSVVNMGKVDDILSQISGANGFLYKPEARAWVTAYPAGAIEKARASYGSKELAGMEVGLVALFQKCPHLGCRVPECLTSQWFECPCHGSKYNRVGEKRGGPAPRGMDRFAVSINGDGEFLVDTGDVIQGPPIGTNTTGQEAEGPNCVGEASH